MRDVSARARPKYRIVVVGGGTGSHTALSGLRTLGLDLTSVVSVMDSGGSSGRLRDEYGCLPPGDARQCLVALAGDDETAAMLRLLFTYRFRGWQASNEKLIASDDTAFAKELNAEIKRLETMRDAISGDSGAKFWKDALNADIANSRELL